MIGNVYIILNKGINKIKEVKLCVLKTRRKTAKRKLF